MEAGDVEMRLAHLQLLQNVVPHLFCGAGRERRNRKRGKARAQAAQLPVVRPEFVAPLGNAMRLIDRKETYRNLAQPFESIAGGQPLRREIEQPIFSTRRFLHHLPAFTRRLRTINDRRWNPHLRQLRGLILHERDQRRNHHRRLPRNHRRQLVAQRLPAPRRHHHTGIVRGQQAADHVLLLGTKVVVSPIAPERFRQVWTSWVWRSPRLASFVWNSFGHLPSDLVGSIALDREAKSVSARRRLCDESRNREPAEREAVNLGVISDTHGLLRAEAVEALRGSDLILHAGDIGGPEILDALARIAPVTAIRGNVDTGPWARGLPETEVIEAGEVSIYLLHD